MEWVRYPAAVGEAVGNLQSAGVTAGKLFRVVPSDVHLKARVAPVGGRTYNMNGILKISGELYGFWDAEKLVPGAFDGAERRIRSAASRGAWRRQRLVKAVVSYLGGRPGGMRSPKLSQGNAKDGGLRGRRFAARRDWGTFQFSRMGRVDAALPIPTGQVGRRMTRHPARTYSNTSACATSG